MSLNFHLARAESVSNDAELPGAQIQRRRRDCFCIIAIRDVVVQGEISYTYRGATTCMDEPRHERQFRFGIGVIYERYYLAFICTGSMNNGVMVQVRFQHSLPIGH